MTEQEALDQAAKAAGYDSWRTVKASWHDGHLFRAVIDNHANEILARHKAEQALADHKAEVSEAVKACFGTSHPAHPLQRFIIPTPDPLYECVREALPGSMPDHHALAITKNLRAAAAKRGLERIDQ